jgi:two-component system LytT family response regulator
MTLRTVIVDGEPLALQRLKRLLSAAPDVEIVTECEDGTAAVEAVQQQQPDLLFLDVQMPGMDGFEVLRELSKTNLEKMPAVVFVTGFDEYAVRAFEARALDYLLKPATRQRVAETLSRARERLAKPASPAIPQALLDMLAEREATASPPRLRRLSVRVNNRVSFISTEDVDWIEAAGNYVILHVGKVTHILRETMNMLEAQLPADTFVRVSRSAIVNLRRIKELQAITPGENVAILKDGQSIAMTAGIREIEESMKFK